MHYYPKYNWDGALKKTEAHYAVPPHWGDYDAPPYEDDIEQLRVVGTSLKEPDCEHVWCGLKNSVKWYGPAIEGQVITTGWKPPADDEEEEL